MADLSPTSARGGPGSASGAGGTARVGARRGRPAGEGGRLLPPNGAGPSACFRGIRPGTRGARFDRGPERRDATEVGLAIEPGDANRRRVRRSHGPLSRIPRTPASREARMRRGNLVGDPPRARSGTRSTGCFAAADPGTPGRSPRRPRDLRSEDVQEGAVPGRRSSGAPRRCCRGFRRGTGTASGCRCRWKTSPTRAAGCWCATSMT